MKIITCGPIVTYVITEHHIATIVYSYNDGQPAATVYIDGQNDGTIEAENGQTMRHAMRCAIWSIKRAEHWDALDDWSVSAEDLTEWEAASSGCGYYTFIGQPWRD